VNEKNSRFVSSAMSSYGKLNLPGTGTLDDVNTMGWNLKNPFVEWVW
jgi:hypothetical protein